MRGIQPQPADGCWLYAWLLLYLCVAHKIMEQQYIVSARKYRPDRFDSMVGQEALTHTLKIAILSNKMAHAYLFCGPRGVGKTTAARVLAKTINCTNRAADGEACNECESCRAFNGQRSMNVYELDAASNNSVDDIRQLISEVNIPPAIGKYKVYIIDEVHMLSQAAFNAFLKTLEEPPEHVIFILATTEKHKILPTILSRCQIFDFRRITVSDIANHLAYVAASENIDAESEALNVIAEKADGGMRDALSLFDRIAGYCEGKLTYAQTIESLNILDYTYYFRIVQLLLTGDYVSLLLLLDELLSKGFDGQLILSGLSTFMRDLMVMQHPGTEHLLEKPQEVTMRYKETAAACPAAFLYRAISLLTECDLNYRQSSNKRLHVELCLMRLASIYNTELNMLPESGSLPTPTVHAPGVTTATAPQVSPSAPIQSPTPVQTQTLATATQTPPRTSASINTIASSPAPSKPSPNPMPRSSSTRYSGRLSLTGLRAEKEEAVRKEREATPQVAEMHEPVTVDRMQELWLQFARHKVNPEHQLLIRAMEQIFPQLEATEQGYPQMKVILPNQDIQNRLEEYTGHLLFFMRTKLHNSDLILHIEVDQTLTDKMPITAKEKMEFLSEKFKPFAQLCEGLNLQPY